MSEQQLALWIQTVDRRLLWRSKRIEHLEEQLHRLRLGILLLVCTIIIVVFMI